MRNYIKKWISSIICAVLFLGCICLPTYAAGYIDPSAEARLTLQYDHGGAVLSGVGVKIYRVADISAIGKYSLSGEYTAYKDTVKVSGITTSADWFAVAETLAAYTVADKISPTAQGQSNKFGNIAFQKLSQGLYLILSDSIIKGGSKYSFAPFLLSIPNLNTSNEWIYDVTAAPKSDVYTHDSDSDYLSYKVLKHWLNEGNTNKRPVSIAIDIYKNGMHYSSQTLASENDWTYSWRALDDGSVWTVVERNIAENYMVTVTKQEAVFTITNTYTTESPSTPPSIDSTPPVILPPTNIPNKPTPLGPSLPQTGQLWWPVPLLSGAGLFLFAVGWILGKRRGEYE